MSDRQRHGLVLLLVAGLIAASFVIIATKKTSLGLDLKGGVELTYQAEPTAQTPTITAAALQRTVDVMNNRVNQLGVAQPQIQTSGGNEIDVQLPNVHNVAQAEQEVGTTARLEFYDWEGNALTTSGQTVASGLVDEDANAEAISQAGGSSPGSNSPTAGAMGFYQAVKLASRQPYEASKDNAQVANTYYLFGNPGSAACDAFYKAAGKPVDKTVHCFINGPLTPTAGTSYASAVSALKQGLPADETAGTQVLVVKRGTVVLQAVPSNFSNAPAFGSPNAGYYVLKDHVALFGNEITNPQQSTDQNGEPDVTFGFTGPGGLAFQKVTAAIATRGEDDSLGANATYQHFAVALDNRLVTVPYIDWKTDGQGIPTGGGSEISGGFTVSSAQQLANELRLGALPVKLVRISESQVSATLGEQALHQGLIAGIIGLAIVMIFLIVYYRVLGVIAVTGLIVYGIYFFALIKLIPITLSLAGIAGLILTIGVAADANIVIFERVKEEIRAGRSVRQGIITGYRKGLTAIIDANVVTILTAFILFVLATSDVKGFAFTLGVGTFVSLFTAVLATQAILMTLGDTKSIQSPSALGASGAKRRWNFDFMGKSRYFFTMSGVILLIGALSIGGRGLNLGIDFTSGTQISFGLEKSASVQEIKTLISQDGGGGQATVQAISGDKALGRYGYQIQSGYLKQNQYETFRNQLEGKYGIKGGENAVNSTSVGPTFGSAVTKSAVIAIIISLLVITLYVALRFDWKFAVPVLIALMHDILISVGVYALTGRVVTTDTVAAILTILGYSLYDTIIVFDRVRENIPRMPRAAFSQIINRSMSEVLTRSLATTSCTLLPIVSLLIFGGSELKDFAFALMIGVASGAYSSIFIASPVLMHWKEREHGYRARRARIEAEHGFVPAYADGDADIDPTTGRVRRTGRITAPQEENVSAAEFEQMKRDLGLDEDRPARRTSTLAKRTAHIEESALPDTPAVASGPAEPVVPAPDEAENDGVAQVNRGAAAPKGSRNRRRHGRK